MARGNPSPAIDGLMVFYYLYTLIGGLLGVVVYAGGAWFFFVAQDVCSFLGWVLFMGPIAAGFAGALWPFLLIAYFMGAF